MKAQRKKHELTIILTHENTDFDGLASLLGAAKVYPDAIPVLPRRPNRNLRHFLTLYCDELPFVSPDDLPRARIAQVILVDTQSLPTIKGMDEHTQVRIIDHHPLDRELSPRMSYQGELLGATTTLFVEEMARQHISLSPVEATLLLLGIYEDTGSLTYATTTPRDVRAAAWLLEQGASLDVLNEFLHYPLSEQQQALYNQLLENCQTYEFAGQSVLIASARAPQYVEEISTLAHKLRDLFDPAALFLLVELTDHIQMVARSTTDTIDVAEVAGFFGGGGHSRAAAAFIRDQTLAEVQARLIEILRYVVRPAVTVGQIMSYGAVHTLSPDTTVREAAEMMMRYGHEGFPVVEEGRIVGVLTRREIDKALHHGLDGAAIRLYMYKGDIHVSPQDSVEHLQRVMMEHGLGQVPVVDDGRIVGIVTRTDLIKLWATPPRPARAQEIAERLEKALPPRLLALLQDAGRTAQEMGYRLYLVGGFVRDLLLGLPEQEEHEFDIDVVVEGDAIRLARRLARRCGGRVRSHSRFGTAKWIIEEDDSPLSIDFATARTEFYEHPTALPQVERSSIQQDLHRRDFTINTLAIRLDPDHYGELLDFFGGEKDLREGRIRVLHSLSFVEDPTRMLRAVRLEQRLGFTIEERTLELMRGALDLLNRVSGERIRHELYLIFQEKEPERALRRLTELGILSQIHPRLRGDEWLAQRYRDLRILADRWSGEKPVDRSWAYLALLIYRLTAPELETVIQRLRFKRDDADKLRQVVALRRLAPQLADTEQPPSALARLLRPYDEAALFILWLATDDETVRQQVERYQRTLRHVRPTLDGRYLQDLGLKPGPIYGRILERLRDARLDGEVSTVEEEKVLVQKLLAEEGVGDW